MEHQRDILAFHVVHELCIQVLRIDDVLLHVCALLVRHLPVRWRVDVDLGLLEVLLIELLERNGTDGCIRVLLLEGRVGDERGNVLFELGQVLHDVVLSEDDSILVVLLLRNAQEELTLLEHINHHSNVRLNLSEHPLGVFGVHLGLLDLLPEHHALVAEGLFQVLFLLLGHLAALINLGDLLFDLLIAFLELVILRVEHVDVVEETVVLLLGFDESGNDLLDVGDSRCLLDLVKSIFNDLDISQVLFHQLSLLFVRLSDFIEPSFQNYDRIGELLALLGLILLILFLLTLLGVVVNEFTVILVVQAHLQLLNVVFKQFFVFLMLSLQGYDLVVRFLRNLGDGLVILVKLLSLLLVGLDLLVVSLALRLGGHELLSEQVDFLLELLVPCLGHVESNALILDVLVLRIDLDPRLLLL